MDNKENDNQLKIEDIPILRYFKDIFSKEVLVVPPKRVIDFRIDLVSRVGPASKYLSWMNIVKLTELKSQLQEPIDIKYIRASISPWGTPVLFVKK